MRKLEVFRTADALLMQVLAAIATSRRPKDFILCDQLQRAALSVPLNLTEGSQRTSTREYARFVEIAAGSAAEVHYLLSVVNRTSSIPGDLIHLEREYDALVGRLQGLRRRLTMLTDHERS